MVLLLAGLFISSLIFGCAGAENQQPDFSNDEGSASITTLEDTWGIDILGVSLTSAEYMIDFRYRVVDPEKARPILDHKVKPYLVDQESGSKFFVPSAPKLGSFRTTNRSGEPEADRTYFVFFANPGKTLRPGSKVTVVIGDFKAADLVIQ